jgi:hypothetical protein
MTETMIDYESLKHVPFLDSQDASYGTDISYIVTSNDDIQNIYGSLASFNDAASTYLNTKSDNGSLISDKFAGQFIQAHKSNVAMVHEMNKNSIEKAKQASNYLTYLKNVKGLTDAVTDIVDNSGSHMIDEHSELKKNISNLKSEINNNKRNLEVNTYYEKKYKRQNEIARNIVILLCFTLLGAFIFKISIFNEFIFIFFIAIMMTIIFFYSVYSAYDMYMRDDIDFDSYRYIKPSVGIRNNDKQNIDIPIELKYDIPGICDIKDEYLSLKSES